MSNKKPNTSGILKNAELKTQAAIEKVDNAIRQMIKDGTKINFNSVSSQSGVSKSFLYNNEQLKNRINSLREQENSNSKKEKKTQDSKDVIIQAQKKRIKELENELKAFKNSQKENLSKFYEEI